MRAETTMPTTAEPTEPGDPRPVRSRGSWAEGCPRCTGLRTGITVTTAQDGTVVAAVELRGTICGSAVPALLAAIDDLHELGADVTVDLSRTTACGG